MYYGICAGYSFIYCITVTDIPASERVFRVFDYIAQIVQIARIGELVKVDDSVVRIFVEQESNEIRADETSPACYEETHKNLSEFVTPNCSHALYIKSI